MSLMGHFRQIDPLPTLSESRIPPERSHVSFRQLLRTYQRTRVQQRLYSAALKPSTILGSRMVKVEPRPGSLWTVMSPPII
jgi:hypothetical protein